MGSNQWNKPGAGSLVLSSAVAIVHGQYDSDNVKNDIALIRLPTPVNFTCEYSHILTNVKIILLTLERLKFFLLAAENLFIYLIHVVKDFSVLGKLSYNNAIYLILKNYCG